MPHLITNSRELADFEQATAAAGAEYCHIHLTAAPEQCVRRLGQRVATGAAATDAVINQIIADNGGVAFIRAIRGQLTGFLAGQPAYAVIECGNQTPEQTLAAVEAVLTARPAAATPSP